MGCKGKGPMVTTTSCLHRLAAVTAGAGVKRKIGGLKAKHETVRKIRGHVARYKITRLERLDTGWA